MHLAAAKSVGDTCHGTGAVLGKCLLGVSVQSRTPQPPGAAVQMRLDGLRGAIGGRVPQGACVTGWPPFLFIYFVGEPKSKQAGCPPAPPPPLVEGSRTAGRSAAAAWLLCVCGCGLLLPPFSSFRLHSRSRSRFL
ncbi:uncharacterized protein Tco025E_09823 [Trypanosoma conorhini]|uniref:Uncharacterized protein n=1 Tax=Trypanosoma conorhini TaxID=83891 RepID=A0A422MS61_9TRYP|nr:uncharacterized protein Tco025E_09823 [Trypanosoma conorhini]RNE96037.1 hypothetical protein Tco025E_09823 [Trypanosoma conorhini]